MNARNARTSLKQKRRQQDSMAEFDRLPSELRVWLSSAVLPWRPGSVRTAYVKALARVGNKDAALQELDRIETRQIARDARHIWGQSHPVVTD